MADQPPSIASSERLTLPGPVLTELRRALPHVATRAVAAIIDEVPSYAEAREFLTTNIERAVQVALGSFLDMAARRHDPSTPLGPAREASYELGRGEARSGRSMDALLSAYRIGARVSWREMSDVAVRAGMDPAGLARFAELVFAYIDDLSAASVSGHADELTAAERLSERRRFRLARDLLRGASPDVVAAAAGRIGWPMPKVVTVAVLPEHHLHAVRAVLPSRTLVLSEDLPGAPPGADELAALVLPDLTPAARRRLVAALSAHEATVGPTTPWESANTAYDRVLRARALPDPAGSNGPVVDTEAHLASLVLHSDPGALEDLRRRALRPLDDLSETTRERLEETLRAWLLHRGARAAVAEELFVHPQTVRYRVTQLRELFGDTLQDPAAVFDLLLALGPPPPREP
jgi:hypothetical protein